MNYIIFRPVLDDFYYGLAFPISIIPSKRPISVWFQKLPESYFLTKANYLCDC